jgi:hypothetical protein
VRSGKAGLCRYCRQRCRSTAKDLVVDILSKVVDSGNDVAHPFGLEIDSCRRLILFESKHLGVNADTVTKNGEAAKKHVVRSQG